ncbi:MAG TPA: metallopeptidase family protein [Syntrophorhabdaceae bacterium]|nr:metallopeptidase family protein [Syntrophorhabdaceae bacterium]HQH43598.1 metallopeptidase family protein [Syntrophorhabdaceae bacterium]HQK46681.1 metallopeptidase family protein [Syntrophorhabdaceae bacterium]
MRLAEEDFDSIVEEAIRHIPDEIRNYLKNIIISVRRRPTKAMLKEAGIPRGHMLLGLYQGVPLTERSAVYPPLYPDKIFLFQEPLEDVCKTREELTRQIEITLVHEIAHFIGMSEERLRELGYG